MGTSRWGACFGRTASLDWRPKPKTSRTNVRKTSVKRYLTAPPDVIEEGQNSKGDGACASGAIASFIRRPKPKVSRTTVKKNKAERHVTKAPTKDNETHEAKVALGGSCSWYYTLWEDQDFEVGVSSEELIKSIEPW